MATEKQIKRFLDEVDEKIVPVNEALLKLEKSPRDFQAAKAAMRDVHSIKSSSAATNFMEISHLMHAMEDVLEKARIESRELNPHIIETLFQSVDALQQATDSIKAGQEELSTVSLVDKLENIAEKDWEGATQEEQQNGESQEITSTPTKGSIAAIATIKVEVKTMDLLMNIVEELLVQKMRLGDMVRQVEENQDRELDFAQVASINESFDRLISGLQTQATQMRMVPLGQIFEYFPRVVRDLAKQKGKTVDITIEGQDIELEAASSSSSASSISNV